MSLSRLASQQVARNVGGGPGAARAVAQPDKDDRFDLLTKYLPVETLTLYVAAMAAQPAITATSRGTVGPWTIYGAGALLTPVFLLLVSYGKHRVSGSTAPFRAHPWPYVASLIAYLAWALSVPGLLTDNQEKILAGFGAVLVSTLLALLETVFAPRPQVPDPI